MRRYGILIFNSIIMFISTFAFAAFMTQTSGIVAMVCWLIFTIITTASMVSMKNTSIPTWKHIRNAGIYVASTVLGFLLGGLLNGA